MLNDDIASVALALLVEEVSGVQHVLTLTLQLLVIFR